MGLPYFMVVCKREAYKMDPLIFYVKCSGCRIKGTKVYHYPDFREVAEMLPDKIKAAFNRAVAVAERPDFLDRKAKMVLHLTSVKDDKVGSVTITRADDGVDIDKVRDTNKLTYRQIKDEERADKR